MEAIYRKLNKILKQMVEYTYTGTYIFIERSRRMFMEFDNAAKITFAHNNEEVYI